MPSDTPKQQPDSGLAGGGQSHGYPVHMSKRTVTRNANVFVWLPSEPGLVAACYNANVTRVTSKTLLRWMGLFTRPLARARDEDKDDEDDDEDSDDDDENDNEDDSDENDDDDDDDDSDEIDDDDSDENDGDGSDENEVNDNHGHDNPNDSDEVEVYEIRRVELEQRGVCVYEVRPLEALRDSDPIAPGVYGCFVQGDTPQAPRKRRPILPYNYAKTLAQIQSDQLGYAKFNYGKSDCWPDIRDNIIGSRSVPEEILAKVSMPHDTCVFTGAKNDPDTSTVVKLYWIFPPPQCRDNLNGAWDIPREVVLTRKLSYSAINVLPMRTDVHELWIANELGVDVDDGYKIYPFTAAASKIAGLRDTLDSPNTDWVPFLREHLLHTVLLRVNGGDIMEDFNIPDWTATIEKIDEGKGKGKVWNGAVGQDALRLFGVDARAPPASHVLSEGEGSSESVAKDVN